MTIKTGEIDAGSNNLVPNVFAAVTIILKSKLWGILFNAFKLETGFSQIQFSLLFTFKSYALIQICPKSLSRGWPHTLQNQLYGNTESPMYLTWTKR